MKYLHTTIKWTEDIGDNTELSEFIFEHSTPLDDMYAEILLIADEELALIQDIIIPVGPYKLRIFQTTDDEK